MSLQNNTVATKQERNPAYFKSMPDEADVYAVAKAFDLQDSSGALHHALKKILLCGQRNGGKGKVQDIKEARVSITRWLELEDEL